MPVNLQPASQTSALVLPSTGTHADVAGVLAYGIYSDSTSFISGAVDQVAYIYNKLGGNVLDLELQPKNVYNAYEESCLEYSYLVNTHQAKNVLSDMLGNTTGTFDQDGELSGTYQTKANLKFPRFQLGYATHIGRGVGVHVSIGATQTIYSASFSASRDVQDYDLQAIIYSSSLESDKPYYNKIGSSSITIQEVYYKTPRAAWRFFGGSSVGTVGNLSTYGMYADDSNFQIVPSWQNVLQAYAYEEDMRVRASHYSFEINNNKLRIYPTPDGTNPDKFWVRFRAAEGAFDEEEDRKYGADGVNNMNALPFPNIPYENINSIGKQWIRRFALSLAKEVLGQVRSKLGSIPIPGNDITLNGPALISEAKEEQSTLREELKTVLDEMVYGKLAAGDAAMQDSINGVFKNIPHGIYVG
jgi:hypothetical protein|tara:strand:+ start:4778 stop:6022 length:1245 start_codon:yes stop_codon:yes gene_type:complete